MITNQYFIVGCFDNEDRPNAEILYSDKDLENVKSVLKLIEKYQELKNLETEEEPAERIRETLEDLHGVNTYDLDIADIDNRVYRSVELKEEVK